VVLAALLVAVALVATSAGWGRPVTTRPVPSSPASGNVQRTLAISSESLYAPNDPWKAYLAGERVCPGGERTNLSVARQVSTVECLINYARKRRGLPALDVRPMLSAASMDKARAIVRCSSFAHDPCGGDWMSAVRATGYRGQFGENLYMASGRWGAPRVAVDAWLNSSEHRQNLFGRSWNEQGVALVMSKRFGAHRDVAVWVGVLGDS
jgi:uncharacterized protein YkwD